MPSIFCFAIYEAYILTVEYNKAFKIEQKQFFRKKLSTDKDYAFEVKGS